MPAPVFDASARWPATQGETDFTGGASPYAVQFTHTCGGNDRYLFVCIKSNTDQTEDKVTAIKYNGVSMTFLGSVQHPANAEGRLWRYGLVNPASGANTVRIERATDFRCQAASESYTGVNQSDPIGTTVTAYVSSSPLTLTVTGVADSLISDCVWMYIHEGVVGSGQSKVWTHWSAGSVAGCEGSNKAGSVGSVSTTWSYAGSFHGKGLSTPLKPVAAIAGGDFIALGRGLGRGLLRKAR